MSLRSIFASVFVVLFVHSIENSLAKPAVPANFPVEKLSLFEPSPSGLLVCVPSESWAIVRKKIAPVRMEHSTGRRSDSLAVRSLTLNRYPIDTLDPPA